MKRKSDILFLQLMLVIAALLITITAFSTTIAHAAEIEPRPKEQIEIPEQKLKEHIEFSAKINDYVKTVKGVSDSVTMVVYDQCFVAIKCEDAVQEAKINEIAREVKKSIQKKFKNINVVFVSTDLNTFIKLDSFTKRVQNGEDPLKMKEEIMELKKLFGVKRMKFKGKGYKELTELLPQEP